MPEASPRPVNGAKRPPGPEIDPAASEPHDPLLAGIDRSSGHHRPGPVGTEMLPSAAALATCDRSEEGAHGGLTDPATRQRMADHQLRAGDQHQGQQEDRERGPEPVCEG